MCEPFKYVVQCKVIFSRANGGLKAAHLNQQVVGVGGWDRIKIRDEVLCLSQNQIIMMVNSGTVIVYCGHF